MGTLIIKQSLAILRLIGCVMQPKNIVNFAVLLPQESLLVVWVKDASSLKQKEDPEELAGLEEILLSCEENVNLYIAVKCFIISRAINKFEHQYKIKTNFATYGVKEH